MDEQQAGIPVDDIVIRPATKADTVQIGMMWVKLVAYHNALDERLPSATTNGAALYSQNIEFRLEDSHTRILVAEVGGQIAGYVMGVIVDLVPEMFEPRVGGFLSDIFVEAEHRQHGIGRLLVQDLIAWFRSRGVEYMEWHVSAHNDTGRAFWQSVGGRDMMMRMHLEL